MPRKAISMPIEVIIVIILAIVVLATIAAFFLFGTGGPIGGIKDNSALSQGCQIWMARGCLNSDKTILTSATYVIPNYHPEGAPTGNLLQACQRVLKATADECFRYCCAGGIGAGVLPSAPVATEAECNNAGGTCMGPLPMGVCNIGTQIKLGTCGAKGECCK